jgi:hypothetical protein
MTNKHKRLEAALRRFIFEALKAIDIFWIIEATPWFKIKQPWNRLYKRTQK